MTRERVNIKQKYYYPPSGKDLNVGYDQFIQRDESVSELIDTLLDALTTVKQKHPSDIQADIVTRLYIDFIYMCVHE